MDQAVATTETALIVIDEADVYPAFTADFSEHLQPHLTKLCEIVADWRKTDRDATKKSDREEIEDLPPAAPPKTDTSFLEGAPGRPALSAPTEEAASTAPAWLIELEAAIDAAPDRIALAEIDASHADKLKALAQSDKSAFDAVRKKIADRAQALEPEGAA